jgi:hypothetical protein
MQNGLWLGMYPPFSTTRCPSRNLTAAWGREHINEIQSRATKWHRSLSFIPNVDLELQNFHEFYEARRQLLAKVLRDKIGFVEATPLPELESSDGERQSIEIS